MRKMTRSPGDHTMCHPPCFFLERRFKLDRGGSCVLSWVSWRRRVRSSRRLRPSRRRSLRCKRNLMLLPAILEESVCMQHFWSSICLWRGTLLRPWLSGNSVSSKRMPLATLWGIQLWQQSQMMCIFAMDRLVKFLKAGSSSSSSE